MVRCMRPTGSLVSLWVHHRDSWPVLRIYATAFLAEQKRSHLDLWIFPARRRSAGMIPTGRPEHTLFLRPDAVLYCRTLPSKIIRARKHRHAEPHAKPPKARVLHQNEVTPARCSSSQTRMCWRGDLGKAKLAAHGVNNAQVGPMRHQPVDVPLPYPPAASASSTASASWVTAWRRPLAAIHHQVPRLIVASDRALDMQDVTQSALGMQVIERMPRSMLPLPLPARRSTARRRRRTAHRCHGPAS